MEVNRVAADNICYSNKKSIEHNLNTSSMNSYGLKVAGPLTKDTISFSGISPKISPNKKMACFARKFLKEIDLKKNQPIHVSAESKYVPFLRIFAEEAYKKGSGEVSFKIVEPEIEALKKKYNITKDFDYKSEEIKELKNNGAAFVNFNNTNCPYLASGLNSREIAGQISGIVSKIPKKISDIFKFNPEEILKTALDMHEGEPIVIKCSREHLPKVTELMDYLYSINKTKLIDVMITESKEFDPEIAFYKYGKKRLIGKFPNYIISRENEYCNKDAAWLNLRGYDPEQLSEINPRKIVAHNAPREEALADIEDKYINNNPWLAYYFPTTKSVKLAYPEYTNPLEALAQAYRDANEINRAGKLKEHIENIELRVKKMNEILEKGYRTIHYVSVDPATKLPDGQTDLKVKLSELSLFGGARMDMKKTGHKPIVNIPTEEIFTSPANNTAEGHITSTKPLIINGQVIDGIKIFFKKGKATELYAEKNLGMLQKYIKAHLNANKLGELAIVAESQIFRKNRLFYDVILDENAAHHIALGNAYTDVIKGANEIQDYAKLKEFLKLHHINSSSAHEDIMIGESNVYVYAENKAGDKIPVVIDDKFLL